ncbi:DMT family transporter [Corticibacter populi]|nr:DMT family transporter [Corticibacter populi]
MSTPASALTGISLVLSAVLFFALLDSSSRYVSGVIPLLVALWVRYAIQTAMTLLMIRRQHPYWLPSSQNWPWQVARACCYILTSGFAFLGLRYIKVAEFTAIASIAPIIVSVLALWVLHEKLPPIRWVLLGLALAGTLVIIRPGGMAFEWVLLLPLAQVAANVLFLLITAHLSRYDDTLTTHLYTGLIGLVVVSVVLPFFWQHLAGIHWTHWLALAGGGLAASIGHMLLAQAYRHAPATVLMPYLYAQIGFAVLLGWLFFGTIPDTLSTLGILMIAASGLAGALMNWRKPA